MNSHRRLGRFKILVRIYLFLIRSLTLIGVIFLGADDPPPVGRIIDFVPSLVDDEMPEPSPPPPARILFRGELISVNVLRANLRATRQISAHVDEMLELNRLRLLEWIEQRDVRREEIQEILESLAQVDEQGEAED